ncbi:MAG: hypothetical protein JNN32_00645 [Flavobacteriales bacterium]|nr:hypothetical protein [Flavobacteriales bacterium]
MEKLLIRAFRAVQEPETCATFLREHRKVLEEFGITNVSTNNEAWCSDPYTYVIIAETPDGRMVGGIRVEVCGRRPLPISNALRKLDPRIDEVMARLEADGTAEVCGLWNALSYNSRGLPNLLSLAAVSVANQLQVRSMVCLVAHYTLRHALRVGFTVIEEVGDGGTFTYPIPSIKAIAMVIPDVRSVDTASVANRKDLMSLRLRPNQNRVEMPAQIEIEVRYELILDHSVLSLVPYRIIEEERLRHCA